MAEEFLNVAEVGAPVEEVGGEGVAETVGRDVVDVSAELDVLIYHAADGAGRDAGALIIEEHGLRIACGFGAID